MPATGKNTPPRLPEPPPGMTWVVNLNIEVLRRVMGRELALGDHARRVFFKDNAALKPGQRVQKVVLDDARDRKAARKLVEAKIWKAYGKSRTEFVIPRTVAFASFEPSWAGLADPLPGPAAAPAAGVHPA